MSEKTDSTLLSATYVVTADDLVAMSRMTERDALPVIHISTAVVLAIGILVAAGNPMAGALVIGLGIGIGILSLTPAFWRFRLTRRSGRVIGQQRSFTFDAAGIHEGPPALGLWANTRDELEAWRPDARRILDSLKSAEAP